MYTTSFCQCSPQSTYNKNGILEYEMSRIRNDAIIYSNDKKERQ
ncbi:hypothetical protein SLUG_01560 [Staphylococcus lugdunensis N920143]|jgi:hypothetical protein|nr:hypothetical protein SLUG_01560 [Staphylococcus lugdunensis N920143]